MNKKTTLGLDLGTNSIGWALVEQDYENKTGHIIGLGSRIVPMDGAEMSSFKRGLPQTRNAVKREKKGIRVGNKRYKLRRNKLVYVLQKLNMLPGQIRLSQPFDNPLKIQKINLLPIREGEKQLTARQFMKIRARSCHEEVTAQEFGKILYKLNQLRGYAGGDDDDGQEELDDVLEIKSEKSFPTQESKIQMLTVLAYSPSDEPIKKGKRVFDIETIDAENEKWIGTTTVENLTIGDTVEMNRRTWFNKKTGEPSSTEFSIPNKTGWRKRMENMEAALIAHSEEKGRKTYIGEYFLDRLKDDNWLRIRDNVILRSRYLDEFDAVWEKQFDKHVKNTPNETVVEIASFLFPGISLTQKQLREEAIEKGLKHIIRNQIIYYQRPLKDQSHLISECRFEAGEKAVANSHPLFQEYKVWEQINKLSINRRIQVGVKKDGKPRYKYQERNIPVDFKEYLYDELQHKKELTFNTVFTNLKNRTDFVEGEDFFNGMSAKSKLVGNITRITLKTRLGKYWSLLRIDKIENEIELWTLLYSGKGNEYDLNSDRNKAIANYLKDKGIEDVKFDQVVKAISKIKFPRNYQSISLEAVNKVLPLVRAGKYFDNSSFSSKIRDRVIKLLNENSDDPYEKSVQAYLEANESQALTEGGFVNAHALMLIYGQHTAKQVSEKELLDNYHEIKALKRHSLRNPLVEQMINETLMVVKDIWKKYGRPNEIKVELARELKNSIKEREKIHDRIESNRKVNERAKKRLVEHKIEISSGNIEKYKLWEEQKEKDPYTGDIIQFSQLFDKGLYDVDHIIPQSRYFDDSIANKVVCAKTVNKDKGNRTAMEYFETGSNKCKLLDKEIFMDNAVNEFFGKKRKHMLAAEIPDNPIERQKKETQYIAVRAREELAKVVGSSHVKTSSGGVTHYLRNHWGITTVFKKLLEERFTKYFRLKASLDFEKSDPNNLVELENYFEQMTTSKLPEKKAQEIMKAVSSLEAPISLDDFTRLFIDCSIYQKDGNLIIKGYTKRIDHRHHAMDALTVACTDEKAVKRLNDLNKYLKDWLKDNINQFDLDLNAEDENLLENFLEMEESIRSKVIKDLEKFRNVERPWQGFELDAMMALEGIFVSHKPKDKLLIQRKEEKDKYGNLVKTSEMTLRIRGALHEETIYGLSSNMESYRIPLSKFAGNTFDTAGNIEKITSTFLRETIRYHFHNTHEKNKSAAFGAEGLMGLNKRLAERTVPKNGKESPAPHPPINSVKIYRKKTKDGKLPEITLQKLSRDKSYNKSLYVNTGSNYLFGILEKDGKRDFDIISLFDSLILLRDAFNETNKHNDFNKGGVFKEYFENNKKAKLIFTLKQLDMVYLPDESEDIIWEKNSTLFHEYWESPDRSKRIFSVSKFSGKQIYFTHHRIAEVIEKKIEFGSQNMLEFYEDRKIAEHCFPIKLDRLGNIIEVTHPSGPIIKISE